MIIKVITFNSQFNNEDVQSCIDDIILSGGSIHWTSHTQDTGMLDIEVYIADEADFNSKFPNTNSYNYSNYQ